MLEETVDYIEAAGGDAMVIPIDMTDANGVVALIYDITSSEVNLQPVRLEGEIV